MPCRAIRGLHVLVVLALTPSSMEAKANTWHKVTAAGAPTARYKPTAVLDSQQRMWIYSSDWGKLNDLHYFSIEANTWHKVTAARAPRAREQHTAVLDSQQRMWIYSSGSVHLNDLHYFSIEANTWHKVTAAGAPTERDRHTAVLDSQQRMWIFGGVSGSVHLNDLHYFSIEANTWHKVTAAGAPSGRLYHTAVLDSQQRMWIFGGVSSDYVNDLHYFSIEVSTSTTSTSLEAPANFIEPAPVVVPTTTVSATTSVTATYTTSTSASSSSTWSSSATQVSTSTTSMRLAPTNFIEPEPAVDGSPTTPSSPTTQPDQALTSAAGDADLSEDPADLLIPILVPTLTCFLAVLAGLGFFCYRDYRARKTRMPQGAAGAEVTFSNPWHGMSLPALPAAVRPLIFAWDARMTAEWPRGKVLNLTVERHEFEAKGRQYSLERPESRGSLQFSWEDGTVQKVDSIQRNVVVWSTQHPRPAWQHFRWICTPQCPVQGHHDMEVQSDRYRCNSCSRSQAAEKHWCCPAHEVHLCPSCAELPPEAPTLGVAAYFLLRLFPSLARSATALDNPNFYEICPHLAHGNTGFWPWDMASGLDGLMFADKPR